MKVRLIRILGLRELDRGREEELLDVQALRIGRGTSNDVQLTGLDIGLSHAQVVIRGGDPYLEFLTKAAAQQPRPLEMGRPVPLGGWELTRLEPPDDEDLVLEVCRVRKDADPGASLAERTETGRRGSSSGSSWLTWGAILCVVTALVLAAGDRTGERIAWMPGPIAWEHAYFESDCEQCHTAFKSTPSKKCATCHVDTPNHVPTVELTDELASQACRSCHIEHRGQNMLLAVTDAVCLSCHQDIEAHAHNPPFGDITAFETEHPEFRLFLTQADENGPLPTFDIIEWSPNARENPGIFFSHLHHAGDILPGAGGLEPALLPCDACHQTDVSGSYMRPISFEQHCQSCHEISATDPVLAGTSFTHGTFAAVRAEVEEKLLRRGLLKRGLEPSDARDRALLPLVDPARQPPLLGELTVSSARARADETLEDILQRSCAPCHALLPGPKVSDDHVVVPVAMTNIWMHHAQFSHQRHQGMQCGTCHPTAAVYAPAAPGVTRPAHTNRTAVPYGLRTPSQLLAEKGMHPSTLATDVMIPGQDSCRTCHVSGAAPKNHVQNRCVDCHDFHAWKHQFGNPYR
jgi:predicted CXXCH cytochrome family protein